MKRDITYFLNNESTVTVSIEANQNETHVDLITKSVEALQDAVCDAVKGIADTQRLAELLYQVDEVRASEQNKRLYGAYLAHEEKANAPSIRDEIAYCSQNIESADRLNELSKNANKLLRCDLAERGEQLRTEYRGGVQH